MLLTFLSRLIEIKTNRLLFKDKAIEIVKYALMNETWLHHLTEEFNKKRLYFMNRIVKVDRYKCQQRY